MTMFIHCAMPTFTKRLLRLCLGLVLSPLLTFGLAQSSYTVQAGDTLFKIARQFDTTIQTIVGLNNLANPNFLSIGQVLLVPNSSSGNAAAPIPESTLPPPEPVLTWPSQYPSPITNIEIVPQQPKQGEVFVLRLGLNRDVPISLRFLGQTYQTAAGSFVRASILPVDVRQDLGTFPLDITINQGSYNQSFQIPVTIAANDFGREAITLAPSPRGQTPETSVNEHQLVRDMCTIFEPFQRWNAPFRLPVDTPYKTSDFGTLRSYNGGPYNSFHHGLDLRGNSETAVYAAAPGVVSLAQELTMRGNSVILTHGLGVCTGYYHLTNLLVQEGQSVSTGTLLGYAGATGTLVTGAHLHWELRVMGMAVNPLQWVVEPLQNP